MGNIRLSYYKQTDGTAKILEETNYYPFGLRHTGYTPIISSTYQYKYNGKEVQESGMYDYGARMYMPEIARWGVEDPLAEQYRVWSPYNYAVNNPMSFIDPDGRSVQDTNGGITYSGDSAVALGAYLIGQAQNAANSGTGNSIVSFFSNILGSGADFSKFDFSYPPNEYEVDLRTGKTRQISDLGGDEIDFYHYVGGGVAFNGRTRIVDRETGEDQWMNSSKDLKGYTRRKWLLILNQYHLTLLIHSIRVNQ